MNEGGFRPLELILPEGKILNARWPAAIGLWSIPLPTVIDTILKALAPALPERIPAAHKGDMGGCSIGGFRPDGRRFLLMNIFGGGWGGRPHEDGEVGLGLDMSGRRAQRPDRAAGDPVSVPDRAFCLAHGFRRCGPASRRPRCRSDLSGAAEMHRQRQQRAHEGSALGVCGRQVRRGQRGGADPPRRQREELESDRRRARAGRPAHLRHRRRRRLGRSAPTRPARARSATSAAAWSRRKRRGATTAMRECQGESCWRRNGADAC